MNHDFAIGEKVFHKVTGSTGVVVGFDFTIDLFLVDFPTGVKPTHPLRLEGFRELYRPARR
jgi:hypothetical protein